ncbi:PDZ domain-containing protein [Desulfobacter postgatei]|uniref:PDZ domain-containing protein n=1 Tax=Desulfobacter postgatei TaxID=2293 RepID=UPI002FDB28E0
MTDKQPVQRGLLLQIVICSSVIILFSLQGYNVTAAKTASVNIEVSAPLLDIHADQVPLIDILKAISDETGVVVETKDLLEDLVSVNLKGVTVESCLQRLLNKKNYALTYTKTGDDFVPVRIMVYGGSALQRFEAAPAELPQQQPQDDHMKNYQQSWFARVVEDSDKLVEQIAVEAIQESAIEMAHLRIQSVRPDSFFYLIGLRDGDQIQNVNGKPVKTARELIDTLQNIPGETHGMIRIARANKNPIYIELH